MKHLYILYFLLIFLLSLSNIYGQSTDKNYIKTTTYLNSAGTQKIEQIDYFNGLGQLIQTVQKQMSPTGKDVRSVQEYNMYLQPSHQWLPTPYKNDGKFYEASEIKNEAKSFYDDAIPFTETFYEPSPGEDIILYEARPGEEWGILGKVFSYRYEANTTSGETCAYYYKVTSEGKLQKSGSYAAGRLTIQKYRDEEVQYTYVFRDKKGRLILERKFDDNDSYIDTYYVYDDIGNLRYVLPPIASDGLKTDGTYSLSSLTIGSNGNILDQYAYYYRYDERGLCIEKKLPGALPIYMVYDKAERLILIQNGNQRDVSTFGAISQDRKWTVNKYDILGRLAYTYEIIVPRTDAYTHEALLDRFKNTLFYESFTTGTTTWGTIGYTNNWLTEKDIERKLISVNYYDHYNFLNLSSVSSIKSYFNYVSKTNYGTKRSVTQGLITGTRVYDLNDPTKFTLNSFYYDEYENQIQTYSMTLHGSIEKNYYNYTFTGQPTIHLHQHTKGSATILSETYRYAYDIKARLKTVTHQIGNGSIITLANNTYNEIGLLSKKALHDGKETISYKYNVRNWLTEITSTNFSQKVSFDGYYNGNIESISWKTGGSNYWRKYEFTYDKLNRLNNASYSEYGINTSRSNNDYNVSVQQYDKHGNIMQLTRYGKYKNTLSTKPTNEPPMPGANIWGIVDKLTLTYQGNHLKSVSDNAPYDPVDKGSMHFVDGSNSSDEYSYDRNGNLTKDSNRKISSIKYNALNLPNTVDFTINKGYRIEYLYDGAGNKYEMNYFEKENNTSIVGPPITVNPGYPGGISPNLPKSAAMSMSDGFGEINPTNGLIPTYKYNLVSSTQYIGNLIYKDQQLDKILFPDGYIDKDRNGKYVYHYYLKDHLGNNRVVIDQTGKVEQTNHYYPFGGLFASTDNISTQPYKFGGKELERMHGLEWLDFVARMYDPVLGRFTSMDPLAEKYYGISPYAYCMNNPINAIDPSGRLVIFINGMHAGDGRWSLYWKGVDKVVMNHLNDYNAWYIDGAMGGVIGLPENLFAANRYEAGYERGEIMAAPMIKALKRDEDRNIIETIKIITHSMGAAYAKGYVQALVNYLKSHNLPLDLIAFEADFAPFQPTKQEAVSGVKTLQFTNMHDKVANNSFLKSPYGKINGAEVNTDSDKNKGHSIGYFMDKIMNLPAGNYKLENEKIIPCQ